MHKNTLIFILKTFVLSIVFVILFTLGSSLINANSTKSTNLNTTENNNKNFKKVNSSGIGNVGIAISTNIGTSFKQINNTPATIYQDVLLIDDLSLNNSEASDKIIGKNMIIINEYLSVVKTDIKQLINNSYDKEAILKAYVEQLEYRYKNGVRNQQLLVKQNNILINAMNSSESKIESLKQKISNDFKNSDSAESLENIKNYVELKKQYYLAKIYAQYINQFLQIYSKLNNDSKNIATRLLLNKDAIIKDAYVVIPTEGGIESLQEFDLIFTEDEVKK